MSKNFTFTLEYSVNGQNKVYTGTGNEDFSVQIFGSDDRLVLDLLPKRPLLMKNAYLSCYYPYKDNDKVFVNGYQSWTTSREFGRKEVQKGLLLLGKYPPVRSFTALFGDYDFQKYSLRPGDFHSYSYSYVRSVDGFTLIGSLNERTGYTVIHFDLPKYTMTLQKDVEGVTATEKYQLFDVYFTQGGYDEVFDRYFEKLSLPPLKIKHMAGYTSWYNYYGGITEEILSRDIDGLSRVGSNADIFQIDDGYQTKTGDWQTVKPDLFPHGMNYLTKKIHEKGYKAGLWLAPFNAAKSSEVVKNHPDWFIDDPKTGKKEIGSIGWGGAYTMDFYIPECADYIRSFFRTVLDEWEFDMVKLDFLYSICHTPRRNKSRGQIMCEAMDFLRECVGDKLLLGCGVPLFPAFGKVDACRVTCDVGPTFKPAFYNASANQEILSTRASVNNSVFRRHLNGRAFVNDPDVFYLRDSNIRKTDPLAVRKSNLGFTESQKIAHATINNMFGDVLFVSDNVGGYSEEKVEWLKKLFKPSDKKVLDAQYISDRSILILYRQQDKNYRMILNVATGDFSLEQI